MRIIPSALTAAHLAAALGRGATDPGQEAALALLLRLPGDLWRRDDIADAAYVQVSATPPTTRVMWAILPDLSVPLSGGERAALRICAALAQIGHDLPALDVEMRVAARQATRHAVGYDMAARDDDAEMRREVNSLLSRLAARTRAARRQDGTEDGAR